MFRLAVTIFLFFFLILSLSCKNNPKQQTNNNSIVKLCDTLKIYNPFRVHIANNNQTLPSPKYKMFVYLNVACSSCLAEMNEWAEISKKLKDGNCECYFILYSKDNFQYFKYLYEAYEIKKIEFPFYLDKNDCFLSANPFLIKFATGQNFLTDEKNNILLKGNFCSDKELFKQAISIINNKK